MSRPDDQAQKKPRKRRIVRIAKWTLIVVALLLLANWLIATIVAGRNQDRIDRFFERIEADSFEEYVFPEGTDSRFSGNGWYLYLGALSTVSKETLDAIEKKLPEGEELSQQQTEDREAALDRVHTLLAEARKAPYSMAVYNYREPLSIEQPHTFEALEYVDLAVESARSRVKAGDPEKGAERLVDALDMIDGVIKLPSIMSAMVRHTTIESVLHETAGMIQALPDPALERIEAAVSATDLEKDFSRGVVGEVFFVLDGFDALCGGDVKIFARKERLSLFPGSLAQALTASFWELGKSAYLDRMLPMALEPSRENARRITEEPNPFYAKAADIFLVSLEGGYVRHREIMNHRAVILEAIRLEKGRRETGEWPAFQPEPSGLPIEVTRIDGGVEIKAPPHEVGKEREGTVFRVHLRD